MAPNSRTSTSTSTSTSTQAHKHTHTHTHTHRGGGLEVVIGAWGVGELKLLRQGSGGGGRLVRELDGVLARLALRCLDLIKLRLRSRARVSRWGRVRQSHKRQWRAAPLFSFISPLHLLPNSFLAPACLPVSLPLSSFLSSPALPRVYASVRARTITVRQSRPQPHMKGGPNRRYHAHIHTYMSASAHTYTHTYAPGSQCLSRAGPARRWRSGRRCHAPTSSPACGHAHALGPLASAR